MHLILSWLLQAASKPIPGIIYNYIILKNASPVIVPGFFHDNRFALPQ